MLLPVFRDLIKPQWRLVLETLKLGGGLPVTELSRRTGASYMAVKAHCEELLKAGYVLRTRVPRAEVGRPEIFYSLAPKADSLFPEAGASFTLELLDEMKPMFGENAPEKLLFQHFENRRDLWTRDLAKTNDLADRVRRLSELRSHDGCSGFLEETGGGVPNLVEIHNPLHPVFERFPRAVAMEQRAMEEALGCRLERAERPTGRGSAPHVVFEPVA